MIRLSLIFVFWLLPTAFAYGWDSIDPTNEEFFSNTPAEAGNDSPYAGTENSDKPRKKRLPRREGMVLGLDPGPAVMWQGNSTPIYVRLQFKLGYCVLYWMQLTFDAKLDILVSPVDDEDAENSWQRIGPAITFFPVDGWFWRFGGQIHAGNTNRLSAGAQSGYEFAVDKYGGVGFALGADREFATDHTTDAWIFAATLFVSAYDLFDRFWLKDETDRF